MRLAFDVLTMYVRVRRRMARTKDVRALVALARDSPCVPAGQPAERAPTEMLRLSRAVQIVLRRVPMRSPCLVQSLVLLELLARRDVEATLVIGAVAAGGFKAHAWVEVDGRAMLPPAGFGAHRLTEV